MGEFTDDVHRELRDALARRLPERAWETEWYVERTPVDVATPGEENGPAVLIEVEMRRADPANNPVKLARYVDEGALSRPVLLIQVFSGYYDLADGGVSTKRKNAEFVGRLATDALDAFTYDTVDLGFTPPKRGGERPTGWRSVVEGVASDIAASVERH